ncbi:uncharacterized protein I303_106070 [Kwoniella dejecticola CBS 10117]|uniref:Short-chain dehydrogenase n=1 Tax=Kwoniella dejecticola CBS 10117 TaxID=1296121 RepID=A0A1A6A182_9TREE|nr:uncharacterized protein I303_06090 [Kwoniella dejecticola CBS 10117]OBR83807.1 hypothetical protein I303_06090 [Kwoniella dejecticola CBS 10117]
MRFQSSAAKPTWKVEDLPDQTAKIAIVTGGNTGIGKALCEVLLEKNAKVYLLARSEDKARAAIGDIKKKTNKDDVHFIKLDLADLSTIRNTVAEFLKRETQLHLLFNNAGVMFTPNGSKTPQGWEMQLGTNGLGPILLTQLLLPTLLATAQAVEAERQSKGYNIVRIINTSSIGNVFLAPKNGGFNWADPNLGFKDTQTSYGQSKFINVAHAVYLASKYGDKGITAHSLHPGTIDSELARHSGAFFTNINKLTTYSVEYGRLSSLYAGLSPEAGKTEENGSYYIPWGRKGEPNPASKDVDHVTKV